MWSRLSRLQKIATVPMLGGAFYAHTHFREYSIQSARDDYFKQRVKVTVAFCDE
jgi:hypothetical protein